ncbi:uncharacterized protein LOC133832835 [Humulus lupulus]|uniref:uncharacterized protein LOC133832835 n=1 Tax=Humulus lupulus TaxID=3486 RepID=UPI002B412CC9|nr:uncharacterized protein LOC133832835 [Humulus lupulus]
MTLVSKADPLRYILSKPVLSGQLAKCSMILSEFEINFVPQKVIKGQALADFLAAQPIPDNMELREDLPDEEVFTIETSSWQLYFDVAAKKCGISAGIVFVMPSGGLIPYSFHILAICTNNVAEYEALIIGLKIALEMQIQSLKVYGDSLLIIKQINGEFAVKHEALIPYHEKAKHLIAQFQTITLNHVPRSKNGKVDALAKLAASLTLPSERDIQITIGERHLLPQIIDRCLSKEEASRALQETHVGTCGPHQADPKLSAQLKRLGYYWPTMVQDVINFVKCCTLCQLHGDFIHQPPQPLHPSILSWPFETWGMDVIGHFTPPSSKIHKYIMAIIDYFSKRSKVVPLKEVRAEDVANFIRTHIIYCYGVPSKITLENALYFKCKTLVKLMEKYKFKHSFSTSYNPSSNGQEKAFNKVLCKILKKMVTKNKRDWHERLLEALWAYRTTVRTVTGCTPYSLVFGSEVVLPLEVQIPSLRIAT